MKYERTPSLSLPPVKLEVKTTEGCEVSLPCGFLAVCVNSASEVKKLLAGIREIVVSVTKTVFISQEKFYKMEILEKF